MTLEDIAVSLETLAAELRALQAPQQPWLVEVVVQHEPAAANLHTQATDTQQRLQRTGSH